MKLVSMLVLILLAAPYKANAFIVVPSNDINTAAYDWLTLKAADSGISADFTLLSKTSDVKLKTNESIQLIVSPPKSNWLKSRIGLRVNVMAGGSVLTTSTVWFKASVLKTGLVYTHNQKKHTQASIVHVLNSQVDLVTTNDSAVLSLDELAGMRLRHPVRAGQVVKRDDFERTPLIHAQQQVQVMANMGSIRVSIPARALTDAFQGELMHVLPSYAVKPIRVRVISNNMVMVEN
jgi:flagella basal body P-ring formation protein FlgA